MPADNGAVRIEKSPHNYRLPDDYSISERIDLLEEYRALIAKVTMASGGKLSDQAVCSVVDDVLNEFSDWLYVSDGHFKSTFKRRLDPHTLRDLRRRPLDPRVLKVHVRSLHVLDAFLQIAENDPPKWLAKMLK